MTTHCPHCKVDYEDDVYVCPVCGNNTEFVKDGATYTLLLNLPGDEIEQANRFLEFLHYEGLTEAYLEQDPVNLFFHIFASPVHAKEGNLLYSSFVEGMREEESERSRDGESDRSADGENASLLDGENEGTEDTEGESDGDDLDDSSLSQQGSSATYVDKRSKYQDFRSSGFALIGGGILAIIFAVLNYLNVIRLFSGLLPFLVLGGLGLCFLFAGLNSLRRSNQLKSEIEAERENRVRVETWLTENVTREMLTPLAQTEKSPEALAMAQMDLINSKLTEQFDADPAFLSMMAEEHYNRLMQAEDDSAE